MIKLNIHIQKRSDNCGESQADEAFLKSKNLKTAKAVK